MNTFLNLASTPIFKISIVLFLVSVVLITLAKKLKKALTRDKKKTILYLIFTAIIFGLSGLLCSPKVLNDTPLNSFVAIQIIVFVMGIIHLFVIKHYFNEITEDKDALVNELLFTVAVLFIGLIVLSNVVTRFRPEYAILFFGTGVAYLVPFLFYKSFQFALKIPVPIFKKWQYPLDDSVVEPTRDELKNPVVIHLKFKKTKALKDSVINFTIKAPKHMEFSRLFYIFINDYNDRHPEDTIEYINNETNEPDQWMFYFQPKWYKSLRHIDFSDTIVDNNIKENDTIICERI